MTRSTVPTDTSAILAMSLILILSGVFMVLLMVFCARAQ
jgi:hypothetical protein